MASPDAELEGVWSQLEGERGRAAGRGVLYRRIFPESPADLYLGLDPETGARLFMLRVTRATGANLRGLPSPRGFEVEVVRPDGERDSAYVQLVLHRPAFKSLFTVLARDLTDTLRGIVTDRDAAMGFIRKLRQWQEFLERHGSGGLTQTEQRGLFGELWFLRSEAEPAAGARASVLAWHGPRGAAQDFLFARCLAEVKTTTGPTRQVRISSERQLDAPAGGALFLVHLPLVVGAPGGESLPDLVESVRTRAGSDGFARRHLEDLLFDAGYLDAHASQYSATRYAVSQPTVYGVKGDFPRVTPASLPNGLADVSYTLDLDRCRHHSVPASALADLLREQHEQP